MPRGIPAYLRYRVVQRFDVGNSEVTADLPHLHQSIWKVVGFNPGMSSSELLGGFTIPLHPPGTKEFRANWGPFYSKLARWQRIEGYLGYNSKSIGLGKLAFAGFITGMRRSKGRNNLYELTGFTDLGLAHRSKPFPFELSSNDVTSAILKSYLGTNELGWADTFNPFTAGNYNSIALPGGSSGSWSGTTDDGLNVVTINNGAAAALVSKVGAIANDRWHTQYVECTGRLVPSTDTTRSGQVGIGFSFSNSDGLNAVLGFVSSQYLGGRQQLVCGIQTYSAGTIIRQKLAPSILYNVDEPNGKIPFTIGLLVTTGGNSNGTAMATLSVNGQVVLQQFQSAFDPGTAANLFPFIEFQAPASGVATAYFTNFAQFVRPTADGPLAPVFAVGNIPATVNSLGYGVDPGPTFLDFWTRLATREGNRLRYTPQPFVVGTRTLGTVDFAADPGNDLTAKAIFRRKDGTLVDLTLDDNSATLAGGTEMSGLPSLDGGGTGYWRDITTYQAIGVIEDQTLALTNPDFNTLRAAARRGMVNKTSIDNAGYKMVEVLRHPNLMDTYREQDRITIDDPEMNVNMLNARILVREFFEGSATERLTLDQFAWHWEG